jgi:uncharacterized protein YjbI with pentapeptide repeats
MAKFPKHLRKIIPYIFVLILIFIVIDFIIWLKYQKSWLFANIIESYQANVYKATEKEKPEAVKAVMLAVAALITLGFTYWRNSIFSRQIKTLQKQTENQGEQLKIQGEQLTLQDRQVQNQGEQIRLQGEQLTIQTEQLTLQTRQVENQTRELQIKDQTRNDEQFKQAVEMLGKADAGFAAQQGAVFILVALAQRSPEHTQRCVDMLCSLNEWVAERLEVQPDYFKREDKADDKFIPWISRVFRENNTAMTAYWNRYLRHSAEAESASINGDCTKQVFTAMNREKLSQLVVKEMRKILSWLANNTEGKEEDKQQTLTLAQRYLPQLDVSGLRMNKMVNWQQARLQGAGLQYAQLQGANLYEAQLQGAVLIRAQLQGANLREAELQGAGLSYAQLQGANLREAELQGAVLYQAQLQGAVLYQAQLQGANIEGARLQGANLPRAQLQGANIEGARLQGADLREAQLQGAVLRQAQLQGAVLRQAQLQGAVLYHTSLMGIDDTDTDWAGAYVDTPDFTTPADWVTLLANPNFSEWTKKRLTDAQVRCDAWAAESKTLRLPGYADNWQATIVALVANKPDWRLPILKIVKWIQESSSYPDALRKAARQAIAAIEALP